MLTEVVEIFQGARIESSPSSGIDLDTAIVECMHATGRMIEQYNVCKQREFIRQSANPTLGEDSPFSVGNPSLLHW